MAVAGVAARKKDGETVSGDGGTYFKREDGTLYVLLCDGMGSGLAANRESNLALRLLEQFLQAGYIRETKVEGRKRSYVLTPTGREALEAEARRLRQLTADYERLMESEGGAP